MKKTTILIVSLLAYTHIFANLEQGKWRWRNDNGSQTTAAWKAGQDTSILLFSTSEILRLRYELYAAPSIPGNILYISENLQYATNTSGPWTTIDTIAGSKAFMMANTSNFVLQNDSTTRQLSGTNHTFLPGITMVDSTLATLNNFVGQQATELEWAIRGTSNTLPATIYYFRDFSKKQTVTYDSYPSLTTASVLPVRLTGFTINREDKKVKLDWATASEQSNDHFEIQRSSDGRTWKTIAKLKGNGTTSSSHSYTAYDESPLSGINYYVIKQYDADGRSYQSDVKSLKMLMASAKIISVSPNPSHSGINFSLINQGSSNVEAILTNTNGIIIHHEIIKSVQANVINKLQLEHQPAPGVYILKLKAEGLSESIRVVIQ